MKNQNENLGSAAKPVQWILKKGHDRRVREGHPWVFSNELASSPKGITPGDWIELVDQRGEPLGFGYGNPHSLIAARLFSSRAGERGTASEDFLLQRLLFQWRRRKSLALRWSARLVFGEADEFPGLILDRYLCRSQAGLSEPDLQVFAAQMTTAGADRWLRPFEDWMRKLNDRAEADGLSAIPWERTGVILRNDIKVRELEGLKVEEPQILKDLIGFNWSAAEIAVADTDGGPLWLACDLQNGQKTGFFLDQTSNIHRVIEFLRRSEIVSGSDLKMVDLCCYVGHWSSQFARSFGASKKMTLHLADVSDEALGRAQVNAKASLELARAVGSSLTGVQSHGEEQSLSSEVLTHSMDVFDGDFPWAPKSLDVVVCDPPALIKSRKAIEQGEHGYMKLNTKAAALVKTGGLLVTCSCSGLLSDEAFSQSVRKGFRRSGRKAILLFKGGHGLDHPQRPEFPEGTYLKVYVYQVY